MNCKFLTITLLLALQPVWAQSLKVGDKSISVDEFTKTYEQELKLNGINSTIDSYISYQVAQDFSQRQQVDTMRFFQMSVANRLNELKKGTYYPKSLEDKFLAQYVADNKKESQVLVFFASKKEGDSIDYQKIYNDVKSGVLPMERAISENAENTETDPIYIKAGSLNWELDQEVQKLPVGGYSSLVENERYTTFVKKTGERPSLGYVIFGTISYPDNAEANAKKDSIYTALKSGTPFQEVAAKFGSTENEKQNGGVVMGSPTLPEEIYNLIKNLKNNEYTQEPVLNEGKWYIFNVYSKRPYDVSTPENREFFLTDMLNSQYGNQFYLEFLNGLRNSSQYKETPLASQIKNSYQDFKNVANDAEVLYSYNGNSFTIGDFKDQIKDHLDQVEEMSNENWSSLATTINNNFIVSEYTIAFENRSEIKKEIDDLKRNLYSNYFYTQYVVKQVDDHPEWLEEYYNAHKDEFVAEPAAKGRVIIPASEADVPKFEKAIAQKDNWENLKKEYEGKVNAENKPVANFHEGEMVESAEVFQKYNVPFKTGVYTAKIGGRTLIMANDEMLPAQQMTLEEAKASGELRDAVISETVKKTIEQEKSKMKIDIEPGFISTLEKNFKK